MYKCINGWTKETMINHIKKEFKGKSVSYIDCGNDELCLYRGPEGKKCAIGMFIPDNLYAERMEEDGLISKIIRTYPKVKYVLPLDLDGLLLLQEVHDNSDEDDTLNDMLDFIEANVE